MYWFWGIALVVVVCALPLVPRFLSGLKASRIRGAARRGKLALYQLAFDVDRKNVIGNVQTSNYHFDTREVARDGAALALFEKDPPSVVATLSCSSCGYVHAILEPHFGRAVLLPPRFGTFDRYRAGWSAAWFRVFAGGNQLTCQDCGNAGQARVDLL